jgi:hypothetical protein
MNIFKLFYLWLTTPAAKASIPPKSTTQDFFERRLLKAAPRSFKEMNFDRDQSGQFKHRQTQHAYRRFSMAPVQDQSNDNFILSMMVAYATDSSIMGYAAGGSLMGGMVGSSLANSHKSEAQASSQRENAAPAPSYTPWYAANNDSDITRPTSRSGGISWANTDDSCRAPSPIPETYYSSPSPTPSPEPSPSPSGGDE